MNEITAISLILIAAAFVCGAIYGSRKEHKAWMRDTLNFIIKKGEIK